MRAGTAFPASDERIRARCRRGKCYNNAFILERNARGVISLNHRNGHHVLKCRCKADNSCGTEGSFPQGVGTGANAFCEPLHALHVPMVYGRFEHLGRAYTILNISRLTIALCWIRPQAEHTTTTHKLWSKYFQEIDFSDYSKCILNIMKLKHISQSHTPRVSFAIECMYN